jgi:hypothetical protein
VIGLSLLLAQRMAEADNRSQEDQATIDVSRAQGALEVMVEKLDIVAEVIHHFDLIRSNADKGQKAVEKLKREIGAQATAVAVALGLDQTD